MNSQETISKMKAMRLVGYASSFSNQLWKPGSMNNCPPTNWSPCSSRPSMMTARTAKLTATLRPPDFATPPRVEQIDFTTPRGLDRSASAPAGLLSVY